MSKRVFIAVLCIVSAFAVSLFSGLYVKKSVERLIYIADEAQTDRNGEKLSDEGKEMLCEEWKKRRTFFGLFLGRNTENSIEKEIYLYINSSDENSIYELKALLQDTADKAGFSFVRIF